MRPRALKVKLQTLKHHASSREPSTMPGTAVVTRDGGHLGHFSWPPRTPRGPEHYLFACLDQGSQEPLFLRHKTSVEKRRYTTALERGIFILCKKPQLTSHFSHIHSAAPSSPAPKFVLGCDTALLRSSRPRGADRAEGTERDADQCELRGGVAGTGRRPRQRPVG